MVRPVNTRSIVAFRSPNNTTTHTSKSALITDAGREYTANTSRAIGTSAKQSLEATVNITPVTTTGTVSPAAPTSRPAEAAPAAGTKLTSPTDEVTFSAAAQEALAATDAPDAGAQLRAERLAQIKADIEAGTYDTDAKFDAAVERMIDKLA